MGHIGKNPLGSFMSNVSNKCGLSKVYTNHSIRVTAATVLTRMKFSPSEIMSVTGHKSVQSLSIYQKTKVDQKIEMGDILFQSMNKPDDEIARQPRRTLPKGPNLQLPPPPSTPGPLPALPSTRKHHRETNTRKRKCYTWYCAF